MKYKLLKDLPWITAWEILELLEDIHPYSVQHKKVSSFFANSHPDFFEPIMGKKQYEDLKQGDICFLLNQWGGSVQLPFSEWTARSETFLTREEAEDEHKRREWACRKDKFIPWAFDEAWFPYNSCDIYRKKENHQWFSVWEINSINSWLAFKSKEECEKAIKEHWLIDLFYKIR